MIQSTPTQNLWNMVEVMLCLGYVKYGCYQNWITSHCWLCDCWWQLPDAFWSVHKCTVHAQIQLKTLFGRQFTLQQDNDPEYTGTATNFFRAKKWNFLNWPGQSPNLNTTEQASHLLRTRQKAKYAPKTNRNHRRLQYRPGSVSPGKCLVMSLSSTATKHEKLLLYLKCPITFASLKWVSYI